MTPDQIIDTLKKFGVSLSRRTLLRYEEWGLIPNAIRGSGGRGVGRFTEYPENTAAEVFAAWHLLRDELKPEVVSKIRNTCLALKNNPINIVVVHNVLRDESDAIVLQLSYLKHYYKWLVKEAIVECFDYLPCEPFDIFYTAEFSPKSPHIIKTSRKIIFRKENLEAFKQRAAKMRDETTKSIPTILFEMNRKIKDRLQMEITVPETEPYIFFTSIGTNEQGEKAYATLEFTSGGGFSSDNFDNVSNLVFVPFMDNNRITLFDVLDDDLNLDVE